MDGIEAPEVLKRDSLGRVTVPRARREALVDEFERSGLPATRFAEAAGVNYQTFAWWVQQRRHARGDYAAARQAVSSALRLVEVVTPAPASSCASSGSAQGGPVCARPALEVALPGDVIVRIADAAQMPLAVELIAALRVSC